MAASKDVLANSSGTRHSHWAAVLLTTLCHGQRLLAHGYNAGDSDGSSVVVIEFLGLRRASEMQVDGMVAPAITILSSYMAAMAAGSVEVMQSVAARTLADLVSVRLRQDGHADAWEEFARSQTNGQVVQYLLEQSLEKDSAFRGRFERVVWEAVSEHNQPTQQNISATGPSGSQVGDNVAIGRGSYHKGDVNTTHNQTVKRPANPLLVLAGVVGVIVVAVLVLSLIGTVLGAIANGIQGGGLTADSTCQQFLDTDQQTEDQAIVDIAAAKGLKGYGSPLALPAVRYNCSSEPNDKLGDVIEEFRGQF
jgi:hypothetical protein